MQSWAGFDKNIVLMYDGRNVTYTHTFPEDDSRPAGIWAYQSPQIYTLSAQ